MHTTLLTTLHSKIKLWMCSVLQNNLHLEAEYKWLLLSKQQNSCVLNVQNKLCYTWFWQTNLRQFRLLRLDLAMLPPIWTVEYRNSADICPTSSSYSWIPPCMFAHPTPPPRDCNPPTYYPRYQQLLLKSWISTYVPTRAEFGKFLKP